MEFLNASHLRNQGAVQTLILPMPFVRLCLNPLEIRDEEGSSKALLCPDARENLGFSVQTGVSRFQKILFKGFLLAKLKFQWNFLTLLTLKIRERFRLITNMQTRTVMSLNPLEIRERFRPHKTEQVLNELES